MDPPSWWLGEEMRVRREELSQARRNIDRALAGVKVKPAAATPTEPTLVSATQIDHELAALITPAAVATLAGLSEDDLRLLMGKTEHRPTEREIKRFAFRTFGDWRRKDLKIKGTNSVMAAAAKDKKFRQDIPIFPNEITFRRALDRRQD
jgi:hypothetical protein